MHFCVKFSLGYKMHPVNKREGGAHRCHHLVSVLLISFLCRFSLFSLACLFPGFLTFWHSSTHSNSINSVPVWRL